MKRSSQGARTISREKLIQTLCQDGQLDSALSLMATPPPSSNTYLSLFKACIKCKGLTHARLLHAHLTHHGIMFSPLLGGFLVVTLAKCGAIEDALHVSSDLPHRSVFSWTAIIFAYVERGNWLQAFETFRWMEDDGICPNATTYASLFKACGNLVDLSQGRILHSDAHKKGVTSEVFVGNTLISMYGKCGAFQEAEDVFCALPRRTVVSWTVMLSAYLEQGQAGRALQVYKRMQEEDTCPNKYTLVFALQACGTLVDGEKSPSMEWRANVMKALEIGHALHVEGVRKGLACDVVVGTALLCLYGKCGAVVEAENTFQAMSHRDLVTWNAMLSTYNDQFEEEKVLLLYTHMQDEGVRPSELTFVIALEACCNMAEKDESLYAVTLDIGQAFHCDIKRNGYVSDVLVGTALVRMYSKCGMVLDAEMAFDALPQRNIITWTAMLSAYVEQAQGEKALALYAQMQKEDMALDDIILIGILQSCGEMGYLDLCKQLHFNITSVGSDRVPFVSATLIHAYGRCSSMLNAHTVFDHLVQPALESWNASISGYAGEGNSVASMRVLEELKMVGMKPDGVTFNGVLSVCTHAGLIVASSRYFESMSGEHGLIPDLKHHANMVDLLGRAGDVKEAYRWLKQMPMQADSAIWSCLLGSCCIHGNIELAKEAFGHAVSLHPKQVGTYILMSNMYVMESEP